MRILFWPASAGSAALCVAALSFAPSCSKGGAAAPASGPVVLGAAAPFTGAESDLGTPVQQMLQLAEAQINAAGGVLGRPLDITIDDDGSDPNVTAAAVTKLLSPAIGAVAIIGPSTSNEALAILPLLEDAGRPAVSGLAVSPALTTAEPSTNRWFFRTESSATFQARAMAIYLAAPTSPPDAGAGDGGAPAACTSAAVIHVGDSSGVGTPVAQEFETRFQATGGTIAYDAVADPNATSYQPLITQLAASSAQCLVLLLLSNQGDLFMSELAAFTATDTSRDWTRFVTMGSTSFYSAGFISGARTDPTNASLPSAAEGMYGTATNETPATPQYNALLDLYQTQFPAVADAGPSGPPLSAVYDAVMVVALAIEKAGSLDGTAIRNALFAVTSGQMQYGPLDYAEAVATLQRGESIHYVGASGSCAFDQNGDVLDDQIVWRVVNGAFVTVDQIPSASLQ